MADDLDGLGTVEVFPLLPNWVETPAVNFVVGRYYQGYPGSSQIIEELTEDVPIKLQLGYMLDTKSDEYDILEFFDTHFARRDRFWIKDPREAFVLKETANLGSSTLKCYPNKGEDIFKVNHRIYIEMDNGDILTRELQDCTYSDSDDATVLSLNTALDREVLLDRGNSIIIARLLLARFDLDTLEFVIESNAISTTSIRFHELVKEYSEV